MSFHNIAKGQNTAYLLRLVVNSVGLEIIADLPEEFQLANMAEWEQRASGSLQSVSGGLASAISGNVMVKEFTRQMWTSSSPLEFSFSLLFDAQTSAYDDVVVPIAKLMQLVSPDTNGGALLLPPGPTYLDPNSFAVDLYAGNYLHVPQCIMTACNANFSSRMATDGYPIAADVEITLRTSTTPSKGDIASYFGAIS